MFQKEGRLAGSWNRGCQIYVFVYFCVFVCVYFYCIVQQSQVRGVNGCLEHWQDQFPPPAQGFQQLPHLFVFLVFLIIIIIILIIIIIILIIIWLILKLTIPNISSPTLPLSTGHYQNEHLFFSLMTNIPAQGSQQLPHRVSPPSSFSLSVQSSNSSSQRSSHLSLFWTFTTATVKVNTWYQSHDRHLTWFVFLIIIVNLFIH